MDIRETADEIRWMLGNGVELKFRVVTDSMAPVIPVGGTIRVRRLPEGGLAALRRFDIVLFHQGDRLICHYLWAVNEWPEADGTKLCVTRGLVAGGEDLPIAESQLVGIVVSHRVGWRYRWLAIRRTWGAQLRQGVFTG